MTYEAINLKHKLSLFTEHWRPKIVAAMNDYQFKLVKLQDSFVWHRHDDTDEVFIVLAGEMTIAFRDGQVDLASGDLYVVPKGVEHRPFASAECQVMLVEPSGVLNTGGADGGSLTAPMDAWI